MKATKILAGLAMLLILCWIGMGCSNPDNIVKPPLPNTGDDTTIIDPNIPTPFADWAFGPIADMAFEKDGDLTVSDVGAGIELFDTFGIHKRNMTDDTPWTGLVDVGPGWLDSGKAVLATGPKIGCMWTSFYDDQYVTGGGSFSSPAEWWWSGEANPTDQCSPYSTSGMFGCPNPLFTPQGIDLHPIYGWLFIKTMHKKVHLDSNCGFDPDQVPPDWDLLDGILAVHPQAPLLGTTLQLYEGSADYVVYHNKSDVDDVALFGYPMADDAVEIFCWDETKG